MSYKAPLAASGPVMYSVISAAKAGFPQSKPLTRSARSAEKGTLRSRSMADYGLKIEASPSSTATEMRSDEGADANADSA